VVHDYYVTLYLNKQRENETKMRDLRGRRKGIMDQGDHNKRLCKTAKDI
jgi:hypothetical protein